MIFTTRLKLIRAAAGHRSVAAVGGESRQAEWRRVRDRLPVPDRFPVPQDAAASGR